jgi:hypothetical protein
VPRDRSKPGLNYPTTRRGRGAAGGSGGDAARQLVVPIVLLAIVAVAGGFAVKWLLSHPDQTSAPTATATPTAPMKPQPQPSIQSSPTLSPAPTQKPSPTPSTPKPSDADLDAQRIQQLKQQTDELVATDLANVNVGWMNARIANLRGQAATLYARLGENADLRLVAQKLDDVEAKVSATVSTQQPLVKPSGAHTENPIAPPRPEAPGAPNANADPISTALADLQSNNFVQKRAALQTLAQAHREPGRSDITRGIETVVLSEDGGVREDAAKALANWADDQTVLKLIPWLDENSPRPRVETAMTVLAATKDKRAVFPIIRWVIKEPEKVVAALSAMGPVAEDEVVKILKEKDPIARKSAARILQEIGGQKSLLGLQRAAADPRDVSAAAAAKLALEVVRERVKQSKPSAVPN